MGEDHPLIYEVAAALQMTNQQRDIAEFQSICNLHIQISAFGSIKHDLPAAIPTSHTPIGVLEDYPRSILTQELNANPPMPLVIKTGPSCGHEQEHGKQEDTSQPNNYNTGADLFQHFTADRNTD